MGRADYSCGVENSKVQALTSSWGTDLYRGVAPACALLLGLLLPGFRLSN